MKEETKTKWVTKTIDVLLPIDGYGEYINIFAYLAKVVDMVDPKYKYIIGLLNTCLNRRGITENQQKMAEDVIGYFRENGYFEEDEDELDEASNKYIN